ncbi:MAG TPA: ATP-binding protein, partial [Polyangiaceae bacterium]|nr:ATP-binding protein [Polyangiaceae bacterium]
MINSLRAKLMLIVGIAALALLATLIGSAVFGLQQTRALTDVEQRLVPKLELGPKLLGEFDGMRQAMQDAVAAQDSAALAATLERRNQIFEILGEAKVLSAADASLVRWAVNDYFDTAQDVSKRLIAGETGESLVDEMARMQAQQNKATEVIKRTTGLSRSELAQGFAAVLAETRRADRFRIGICLLGLVFVLGVSFATSRGVLVAVRGLSKGFSRFATGDFSRRIERIEIDELGKLAREANQMAESLAQLAERRAADDWLKEGLALAAEQLRGDLEPKQLAGSVLRSVARHVGAVAGALYWRERDELHLYGQYAFSSPSEGADSAAQTAPLASGLLGEAARAESLTVIDDPPPKYFELRSGLGSGAPRALVFLPLVREKMTSGVLELALLSPCSQRVRDLLLAVQEMLVVGLQAAASRAALASALSQSQALAEQLGAQEEELRVSNQELQTQHEELRVANSELEEHRQILSEQNSELERTRLGLQQKAEELSKVSSYKSQFLANMSHELRTPLNSMLLLSHLLADNEGANLTPKQVEYCKTIHGAGKDLLALINQVLDLAKIEAGRQELELEITDLARFAEHARRVFEPLAQEKGLALRVEFGSDLPATITTDAQRVERIVTNLLGNAIKFTERGEVKLRIARPASNATISRPGLSRDACIAFAVSDTGIGIPKEAQERVFAPFEQLEARANRRYAGTGLGLAISRESALLLGGEIVLESQPGRGSTFTCYLPLASAPPANAEQQQQPNAPVRAAPAARASDANGTSVANGAHRAPGAEMRDCLLVIEDDPVLSEQLVEIIRGRRLRALSATSGREGLRVAREER